MTSQSHRTALFFRFAAALLAWLGVAVPLARAQAPPQAPQVIYYGQGSKGDVEHSLQFQVLSLAVRECGKPYVLKPSPLGKSAEARTISALADGEQIDVAWLGVSAANDRKLLPVRIPIDRGLMGYRIFLIDGARQPEFDRVRDLTDLRRMKALQGVGWQDVDVLRLAGLQVSTADYSHLFRMTLARRGDFFPRSAFEAFGEQAKHASEAPGLAVEKTLVLHYPQASMFYVRRSDPVLHDDLYRGLLKAYDDGAFMTLFNSNPGVRAALDQAHLKSRRVIEIDNPFLSAETRAIPQRFWYRP